MKILPFLLLLSIVSIGQENNDSISILRYAEINPIARPITGKKFQTFIARDDQGNFISILEKRLYSLTFGLNHVLLV
jgi:hypothetical protein